MAASRSSERLNPSGTFLLGVDVDDTLLPIEERPPEVCRQGYADLQKLNRALERTAPFLLSLGTVSGRSIADLDSALRIPAFRNFVEMADFKIASVGTVVHHRRGPEFEYDPTWPPQVEGWEPLQIRRAMHSRPELEPQPLSTQNDHKISYFVSGVSDAEHDSYVGELEEALTEREVAAQIIFSSGQFLDFLPIGIHKGSAYNHVLDTYEAETGTKAFGIAAENSMNGKDFLEAADFAIVPGNADSSLQTWVKSAIPHKSYVAREEYAAGVLEGLQVAGWLGLINFSG